MKKSILVLALICLLLSACHNNDTVVGTVTHKMAPATPFDTPTVYGVQVAVKDMKFEYTVAIKVSEYVYNIVEIGNAYEFRCSHACGKYGVINLLGDTDDGS